MVDISPQQVMEMKRRKRPIYDELNAFDRQLVPETGIRIDIPFADVYSMRAIAEELHGLANDLDRLSRQPAQGSRETRSLLLEMQWRCRERRATIRSIAKNLRGNNQSD